MDAVDGLDRQENHERDDGEVDDGLDEYSVIEQNGRHGFLAICTNGSRPQHGGKAFEISATEEDRNRRHDHVIDQRGHYFPEGSTDDHTDRQVDELQRRANSLNSEMILMMLTPFDD